MANVDVNVKARGTGRYRILSSDSTMRFEVTPTDILVNGRSLTAAVAEGGYPVYDSTHTYQPGAKVAWNTKAWTNDGVASITNVAPAAGGGNPWTDAGSDGSPAAWVMSGGTYLADAVVVNAGHLWENGSGAPISAAVAPSTVTGWTDHGTVWLPEGGGGGDGPGFIRSEVALPIIASGLLTTGGDPWVILGALPFNRPDWYLGTDGSGAVFGFAAVAQAPAAGDFDIQLWDATNNAAIHTFTQGAAGAFVVLGQSPVVIPETCALLLLRARMRNGGGGDALDVLCGSLRCTVTIGD